MKTSSDTKQVVRQTVEKLEAAQDATRTIIERIGTRCDKDGNDKPPIDEESRKVVRYLHTAANYALDGARYISPEVADVKAHPLPAFQDLVAAPVSKRTLKDVAGEITGYLDDELQYFVPGMMHGLEDFLVSYQGEFCEALQRLTEKKIAVCDTLGKPGAKKKLVEAFTALPSFPAPEAYEEYCKRVIARDEPDPTDEIVTAWREHRPAPFPHPDAFKIAFYRALALDAEATAEINGKTKAANDQEWRQSIEANVDATRAAVEDLAAEIAAWREWVRRLAKGKSGSPTPQLCASIKNNIVGAWKAFNAEPADCEVATERGGLRKRKRTYDEFLAVCGNKDIWYGQTLKQLVSDGKDIERIVHSSNENARQKRAKHATAKVAQARRKK